MSRASMLRAFAMTALFFATTLLFVLPSWRLADPMTLTAVDAVRDVPFPILVVAEGAPRVALESDPRRIAPPPPGSSYFVPAARAAELERRLNAAGAAARPDGGRWRLRVEELGRGRERIDLTFVRDGYRGAIYEATATSIRPLQRRITGPGFALVVAEIALAMNAGVWIVAWIVWLLVRRRRARP